MSFIGIDLGTSSVKVLAIEKSGEIIGSASKEYPVYYPKTNYAEQDPEDWWTGVKEAMKELVNEYPQLANSVESISFSGQMHGLVALDKNNEVLIPAILWCDQRTAEECDDITQAIGQENLTKYTSNKALTGFTAPKILWVKKNQPEIFEKIEHIMLPKDYIQFRLTGEYATDVSDASGMLLLDVKNRKWSQEMIDFLGIKEEMLPKLFESYEVTGSVQEEVKKELGLEKSEKILVAAGAGDQAAGAIGAGVVEDGILSVALGTSGVVFVSEEEYSVDTQNRLHSFCHANGKYHQMGVVLSAAGSLKWWIDQVQKDTSNPYQVLQAEAEKVKPGSEGLYFLPYLLGERTPYSDPDAKGCFIGISISHSRSHMTRAVLEGVIYALRDSLEIIKDIGGTTKEIRLIGGGAKSPLWQQIVADIFDIPVYITNSSEGPAFGAAILALVAAGHYSSVDEACKALIATTKEIEPIKENVEIYNKHYEVYSKLYGTLQETFKDIAKL
ncbi:MAG TPA: xylulokinase [Epulopiscium sp.]|nr:xylulokinase [Candidatus Epulonipiscium sp.]